MKSDIIQLTVDDLVWPFTDDGRPYYNIGPKGHSRRTYVDPCPAYPHEVAVVRDVLRSLEDIWPLPFPLLCFVLPRECCTRTNGWKQVDWTKWEENGRPGEFTVSIALSAKRIPPHPALTHYTVAHEYGHAVEEAILVARGLKPDTKDVLNEYKQLRNNLVDPPAYGAGCWHLSPGEVFANDFRVLIAKIETEYWPHAGILRPEEIFAVQEWWERERTRVQS